MNDQNRVRLQRIAATYASRAAPKPTAPEPPPEVDEEAAAFLAAFARVRDEVLRPAMAEVGLQLKKAGYAFRISPGGDEEPPSIDLHVILADRADSKDTVRFFARKDAVQGWLMIGELELTGSPVELARFETTKEITHEAAEQLVVDAVEQMLAPVEAPRNRTPSPLPPGAIPAPAPPLPPDAPARLPVESLPVAKPYAPVVATEPPAFVASRRSPFAATSMALDLPIGPALPFSKNADDTLPLPPPKPSSPGGAADTPSPLPTTPLRVNKAPAHLAGTVDLPNRPIGPALPFAQSPGAQAPPPSPTSGRESGPTPAAPALPRVNKAPAELAGTVDLPNMPIGPALPFAKSPGAQADESGPTPAAPALPRVNKAPAHLSGTISAFDLHVAAALPFAQGAAGEPPSLTVEEYASFRASLTVKGEEDPATWKQFGIVSQAMKDALQARFAARFRDDPEARDRFVALLQRTVSELRAKEPGA